SRVWLRSRGFLCATLARTDRGWARPPGSARAARGKPAKEFWKSQDLRWGTTRTRPRNRSVETCPLTKHRPRYEPPNRAPSPSDQRGSTGISALVDPEHYEVGEDPADARHFALGANASWENDMRIETVLIAAALSAVLGTPASGANVSAKKMLIKDNAVGGKQQLQYLSVDQSILATDGYGNAVDSGVALQVVSEGALIDHCLQIPAGGCTLTGGSSDQLRCRSANGKDKVQIKPGKASAKFKGSIGYELDALVSQVPLVMILRAGNATYCSVCGNGGSDLVKKDGSDGRQVLVKTCDPTPCPAVGPACTL